LSRVFSIPTILRLIPNNLLRQFFQTLGHTNLTIPWDKLGKRDPKPILRAIQTLPPLEIDQIEAELHTIFDLASDTGIAAIREAGSWVEGPSLLAGLPEDATPYQQAMTAWLANREVISDALRIHQVENLTWWRKRNDLPPCGLDNSRDALNQFEKSLSALLLTEEGRGRVCTVETMNRKGIEYVFAYPDDYAHKVTAHDIKGQLVPRTIRQTFPIIFAFSPTNRTLETFAKLPSKTKPKVEALFAKSLLGVNELRPWPKRPTYQLNHLKDRTYTLDTDPSDCIRAQISQMRLKCNNSDRQMIFTGDLRWAEDTHNLIDDALNQDRVPLSSVDLTMVRLEIEFLDGAEPRSLTLDVACPGSCNLRNLPPNRIDVVQKYLRRWRIEDDRPADGDMAAAG
jgi:hypothetical protein